MHVLVQTENKMELQKKKKLCHYRKNLHRKIQNLFSFN
jgi:hypothetical protein